jgi:Tol biopolymer transport system component
MSSRRGALLLALALLAPSCKGNVNDHTVIVAVTDRASVSTLGVEGNDSSIFPSVSADGRYVAFQSKASNLVPGDTSGFKDVFRKDMITGQLELVSVNTTGGFGNGDSTRPSISADGRYVAFQSDADDLVASDTNGVSDIFIRDMQPGGAGTIRVSVVTGAGAESFPPLFGAFDPVISANGAFVAFRSDATDLVTSPALTLGVFNVFRHPRAPNGTTDLVSVNATGPEPDFDSSAPSISGSGQFVAFESSSTNLIPAGTTGQQVYVRDMTGGSTALFSVDSGGVTQGDALSANPSVSDDGTRVVFESRSTNLAPVDVPGQSYIFLHVTGGPTSVVSKNSAGFQAIGSSVLPAISADGRYIVYMSGAENLVPADTNGKLDVFWFDSVAGLTLRVSVGTYGAQANDDSGGTNSRPALSPDGRFVAFDSLASNLVAADGNSIEDAFVHGPMY